MTPNTVTDDCAEAVPAAARAAREIRDLFVEILEAP
jgi:hypothetical protein